MTPPTGLEQAHRTSFGTAIRHTTVYSDHPDPQAPSLWVRQAPLPEHSFSDFRQRRALTTLLRHTDGHRWVLGLGDHTERHYPLPTSVSLAGRLLDTGSDGDPLGWPRVFHRLGTLLAGLHTLTQSHPDLRPDAEPPARTRLRAWWEDECDRPDSAARDFFTALPPVVLAALTDHLGQNLRPGGVLLHGWIGLGQAVLGPDGGLAVLLGEDHGTGPGEYDLGALVAQAVELAAFAPVGGRLDAAGCRDQLHAGYRQAGGEADPGRVDLFAIEHVARHVCDFVQFATYDPSELPVWARLVGFLGENHLRG